MESFILFACSFLQTLSPCGLFWFFPCQIVSFLFPFLFYSFLLIFFFLLDAHLLITSLAYKIVYPKFQFGEVNFVLFIFVKIWLNGIQTWSRCFVRSERKLLFFWDKSQFPTTIRTPPWYYTSTFIHRKMFCGAEDQVIRRKR